MSMLLINAEVQSEIERVLGVAQALWIPWSVLQVGAANSADVIDETGRLPLSRRPPGWKRPPSQHLLVPVNYHCAISFEEQPVGLCRHLSISIENGDGLPHPHAIRMLATAFGFSPCLPSNGTMWLEEFAPERWAVNVIELASAGNLNAMEAQGHG